MDKNKKLTASKEDYLKAMLEMSGQSEIHSCELAEILGVTRASVSHMMMVLKEDGYVNKEKYGKVRLTQDGIELAMDVTRRYDLLKTFFGEFLGVDTGVAERDACRIEHLVSFETLEKIERRLQKSI